MRSAYEIEVRFIGEPNYIYTYSLQEAEDIKRMVEKAPVEHASWGDVKTTATITPISLRANEVIECGKIITKIYPAMGRKRSA